MKTLRIIIAVMILLPAVSVSGFPLQHDGGSVICLQLDANPGADPVTADSPSEFDIARACYITLFELGPDGEPQRYLCRDYMLNWLSGEINLILHKAGFSNGRSITADDCKFTLERVITERPDLRAGFAPVIGVGEFISGITPHVEGLVAQSGNELVIRMESAESTPGLLRILSNPATGIISKDHFNVVGRKYFTAPVTSGPFTLTQGRGGITLTRQINFPYSKSWLNSITLKHGTGEAAHLEFSVGAAEMLEVPPEFYNQYRKENAYTGHRVEGGVMLEYALLLDPEVRPLNEDQVRRAICLSIDNSGLTEVTLGGAAMDSYVLPADVARVDYRGRLEAAKAALANYADLDSTPLELAYPAGEGRAALLADRIATNLDALGITVTPRAINNWGDPGAGIKTGMLLIPVPLAAGLDSTARSVVDLAKYRGFGGATLAGYAQSDSSAKGCYLPLLQPLRLVVTSDAYNPPALGSWGEIDFTGLSLR